jgi:hypothetical protein
VRSCPWAKAGAAARRTVSRIDFMAASLLLGRAPSWHVQEGEQTNRHSHKHSR